MLMLIPVEYAVNLFPPTFLSGFQFSVIYDFLRPRTKFGGKYYPIKGGYSPFMADLLKIVRLSLFPFANNQQKGIWRLVVQLIEKARMGASEARTLPDVLCKVFTQFRTTHFPLIFSARANSSAAPSPRHALPCMHASIAGFVAASLSIITRAFLVCEK